MSETAGVHSFTRAASLKKRLIEEQKKRNEWGRILSELVKRQFKHPDPRLPQWISRAQREMFDAEGNARYFEQELKQV